MSSVVVTHQSWTSRLGSSLKGVGCGLVMILLSIGLLVWNEGNTVAAHKALAEGLKVTTSLASNEEIDSSYEGKVVHLTGEAVPGSIVSDSKFGIVLDNMDVLKLRRSVSMYQWVEHKSTSTKKNAGGSTTTETAYSYDKRWDSSHIDSGSFHESEDHYNPSFAFQSFVDVANPINFGAFELSSSVSDKISWFQSISTDYSDQVSVDNIPEETMNGQSYGVSLYNGEGFYFGKDVYQPVVGDTKVTFQIVPIQTVSIIALQSGSTFASYVSSNGRAILLVERGTVSKEEMFEHANQVATFQAWLIRFLGFFLMWFSLQMVFQPLAVFADVIPILGNFLEGVSCLITFVVAAAVSGIVIALSWIAVRPFLSFSILAVVAAIVFYCYKKRENERSGSAVAHAAVEYELSRTHEDTPKQQGFSDNP